MATRLELDKDGILNNTTKPVISLLSVSPLHELASESDEDVSNNVKDKKGMEEAARFTAEDHHNHIYNIFQEYYGIDIDKWLTNQRLIV